MPWSGALVTDDALVTSIAVPSPYEPMTVARLAVLLTTADDRLRWCYLTEFLEEFSWESP
jgi:hypothetical protein